MRRNTQVVLLVCLVLVLGYWGYQWRFGEEAGVSITVISTSGEVDRIDGGGAPQSMEPGDTINVHDSIKTGADGLILMGAGEGSQLSLTASSSMRVLSTDLSGVRVELENGKVRARVRPGSPALGVTNRGRAVNATDADFTIVVDPEGAMGVETERGDVNLQGFEGATQLTKGQRLRALPGQESISARVPATLLLEVAWPETAVTRSSEVTIRGKTDPYASVVIGDGTRVRAGADGKFRAQVILEEGSNDLDVRVRDLMGRESAERRTMTRDTKAPDVQSSEVVWGR